MWIFHLMLDNCNIIFKDNMLLESVITPCLEKDATLLLPISLPNVNRHSSTFFPDTV